VDFNDQDEDGVECKEDKRVDEDGFVLGLHATKL